MPSPPCPQRSDRTAGYSSLLGGILTATIGIGGGWFLQSLPGSAHDTGNGPMAFHLTLARAVTTDSPGAAPPATQRPASRPKPPPTPRTAATMPPPAQKPRKAPAPRPAIAPRAEKQPPEPVAATETMTPIPAMATPVAAQQGRVENAGGGASDEGDTPAPPTAPIHPGAGDQRRAEKNRLLARLRQIIEQEKHYPWRARRAGYSGSVTARVTISADARVRAYEITGVSGHRYLRRGAERTLQRLVGRRLASLPLGEELQVSVPIVYRLR